MPLSGEALAEVVRRRQDGSAVDVDHAQLVVDVGIDQRSRPAIARCGDDETDLQRRGDVCHGVGASGVGQIRHQHPGVDAVLGGIAFRHLFQDRAAARHEDEIEAAPSEAVGKRPTDSLARARDDGPGTVALAETHVGA